MHRDPPAAHSSSSGLVVRNPSNTYSLAPAALTSNRAVAARYGLNVADIEDVIETVLGGKVATSVWEGEKRFGIVVRLNEGQRALDELPNILVTTSNGVYLPLSQVAHFRTIGGSMNISRENGGRVIAIGVFIRDRDMGSVVADNQPCHGRDASVRLTLPPLAAAYFVPEE